MKTAGLSTNIDELHDQIHSMTDEIRCLKEQLFLATRRQFGSSSETFSPDQYCLFFTEDTDIVIVETEVDEGSNAPEPTPKKKLRQTEGDTVAFIDKAGTEHTGSIVRLNRKTATVQSREGEWRVDYTLLHKVIDVN